KATTVRVTAAWARSLLLNITDSSSSDGERLRPPERPGQVTTVMAEKGGPTVFGSARKPAPLTCGPGRGRVPGEFRKGTLLADGGASMDGRPDADSRGDRGLRYPFEGPPETGAVLEVARGVLWLR